jgi:hypothetical protein
MKRAPGRQEYQDCDRVYVERTRLQWNWHKIPFIPLMVKLPTGRRERYAKPFFRTAFGTLTTSKYFYYNTETGEVVEDPYVI